MTMPRRKKSCVAKKVKFSRVSRGSCVGDKDLLNIRGAKSCFSTRTAAENAADLLNAVGYGTRGNTKYIVVRKVGDTKLKWCIAKDRTRRKGRRR